jgi:hypothetical protein
MDKRGKGMGASNSSRGKDLMGLPIDVVLTSVVALVLISIVVLGDLGIAAQVRPGTPGSAEPTSPEETKWVLSEVDLSSNDGYTSEKTTTEVKAGELPDNTTAVKVALSWTDDYGSNDVFKIELQLEGTSLGSQEGSSGSLSIDANATEGKYLSGNLTVLVTCVSSPGLVGPNPFHVVDKGNSWTVKATATVRVKE